MKIFDTFLRPVITEKSTSHEKEGKYQFIVRKDVTKIDVRKAFEKLYDVKVAKVNMMVTPKKIKTGRTKTPVTKKPEFKKVIVTTKAKKVIDPAKPKLKS